jgi:hypothetical protein
LSIVDLKRVVVNGVSGLSDDFSGIVNEKKLRHAGMYLNQQEIDAISTGQIRPYIEEVEISMKDPSHLKQAKSDAVQALNDEHDNDMIVEVLEDLLE